VTPGERDYYQSLEYILRAGCDHAEPSTSNVCGDCLRRLIAEEREACAKVADDHLHGFRCNTCASDKIAAAIRART